MPTELDSQSAYRGIDRRMVALTRLLLASSALLIIFIDPTEPDRLVGETYVLLIFYTFYSLYIFLADWFDGPLPSLIRLHPWWIDTAFYLVLISLSSGTSSIFFFFFFFAVLTAAFARGFQTGLAVTGVSALGFWIVAVLATPPNTEFDLSRYLLRSLSLLVLGYMMSIWGGHESRSRRRLEVLRQIGLVSNPRFGIDRTFNLNLELIRNFYRADACLIVSRDAESGLLEVRNWTKASGQNDCSELLKDNTALGQLLTSLPDELAALFEKRGSFSPFRDASSTFDCVMNRFVDMDTGPVEAIAGAFQTVSLLTIPIFYRNQFRGRFFVYSTSSNVFDKSDIHFLKQAIDHFIAIAENIRLVDQMASDAAEEERKRIARDIHDSIIQPYIGLQIGIGALSDVVDYNDQDSLDYEIKRRVDKLKEMADQGIEDLRGYVHGLSFKPGKATALFESLQRFAHKFSESTGITVELDCPANLSIGDRLAAELFQIVAEALSNVRRHTSSDTALVWLRLVGENLVVAVQNRTNSAPADDFVPKSIAERSESLGGMVAVTQNEGSATVTVSIPL